MSQPQPVTFNVTRQDPELVVPAKTTPNGLKDVSDCDDMPLLRTQVPIIQFFRKFELAKGKDPAKVIKEAIAQALIYYYPLAGRLREVGTDKKPFVDCTGEGVIFVEADADVSIDEFGDLLHPPFPGELELLSPISTPLFDTPLMHFQVTRLKCGGFIVGAIINHVMADGIGINKFLTAVSEIARGLPTPSIRPVWDRHLLKARDPPQVTFEHHAFDQEPSTTASFFKEGEKMAEKVLLFDPAVVSALRKVVSTPDVPHSTTFELIAAAVWRARTLSLELGSSVNTRLIFPVDVRDKLSPPIPEGYYGNVVANLAAMATADELKARPIRHAAELLKKAKSKVMGDNLRSFADLMALCGLPPFVQGTDFFITDLRWLGTDKVDYGWGKPVYGGPAKGHGHPICGFFTCLIPVKNTKKDDEHGIAVPMILPEPAMDSFVNELDIMMAPASTGQTWMKATTKLLRWAPRLK